MPGSYLGAVTIGGSVDGLDEALDEVGAALVALEAGVAAHMPCFDEAIAALATAHASIRPPAIAAPDANLTASASIAAQLPTFDPLAYLQNLIAGLQALLAQLAALDPTALLDAQISANAALGVQFTADIGSIDIQLSALLDISALLTACSVAIAAALAAAAAGIASYTSMSATLNTAGAHAFLYTGQLSGLGSGLDAVTPSSGIAASDSVQVTVQVVRQASTAAIAAQNAVFKTS